MKKSILVLLLITALVLAGCGTGEKVEGNDKTPAKNGFVFAYNGVEIPLHANVAPIVEDLGEPMDYFEAESCAFQGLDKTYFYSGFDLTTYPQGDKNDRVSVIDFKDDSISTKEGIYIGSPEADVVEAYGDDYEGGEGSYVYTEGDTSITFLITDGAVSTITYQALVDGI